MLIQMSPSFKTTRESGRNGQRVVLRQGSVYLRM